MSTFDLANLYLRHDAESRSLSAENPTGEKGKGALALPDLSIKKASSGWPARELGQGWKVRPCIDIAPGATATLMDHEGPGVIRHIWITFNVKWSRSLVLRVYWDGQAEPSIACPLADFFCNAWDARQQINALPINVNSAGGMNSFLPMPFRKHARITVTNEGPDALDAFFYTINYTLEPVPERALYLHAHWRRSNPLPEGEEYVIVEGVRGDGHYVGTFMAWQQNTPGWWGEGEIKMYLDGDRDFPTICGTGTEDYFGGAWCFVTKAPPLEEIMATTPPQFDRCETTDYSAPFFGFQQVRGRNLFVGCRMTLYRFHVSDPVYFKRDLKVTMQALGWKSDFRYAQLKDDLASVAYWYQTLPHAPLPALQPLEARAVR
ncbi:MAG TPA: glycoside hydrolase family 172 protein [Nevskiaceae bacterium]|nr:glycoside hydrolase family 172 protein [Nevskiaceae bacterium]